MDLALALTTFALIFPAELPDKTFIATLVLATRYRHLPVWIGVVAAFAVQVVIAVAFGGVLSLLPQTLVLGVTSALFAIGAIILVRGGLASRASELAEEAEAEREFDVKAASHLATSPVRVALTSFAVLFTAEWGDLSQLLTAGMAARTGDPVSVAAGAWLALACVAAIAVVSGRWLQRRIAIWRIRLVSGAILAGLAAWSAIEFARLIGN